MDRELVLRLAAEGNLELAEARLRDPTVSLEECEELEPRLRWETAPVGTVFAPLPPRVGESEGITCAVFVEIGRGHSECLDESRRRGANAAVAEAWRIIGGHGAPPAAGVVLELCDRLGCDVVGHSVLWPALIAAVQRTSTARWRL